MNSKQDLKQLTIVLIADRSFKKGEEVDIEGSELEMISDEYFEDIYKGLSNVCKNVVHYQSPKDLIENISAHTNDLVMTIYGGTGSRNRMSLVPAICEAYGIKFVGADAYSRTVCQDKFLSKEFVRRFNIPTPAGVLFAHEINETLLKELRLPLMIKPNFEGSSIGISEKSKAESYEEAMAEIKYLRKKFGQEIIVEEFISGKEICICVLGSQEEVMLFRAMEVFDRTDNNFLLNHVYSAWEKHQSEREFIHRDVTSELTIKEQIALKKLFCALGKMDFMRIDGRLDANGFTLIELTPDAYIGKRSAIADAAKIDNLSYEQLLEIIIRKTLERYHTPYSSYIES